MNRDTAQLNRNRLKVGVIALALLALGKHDNDFERFFGDHVHVALWHDSQFVDRAADAAARAAGAADRAAEAARLAAELQQRFNGE